MIRYSTNWMGPVSYDWVAENGDYWACGRIDIYGTDSAYPDEYSLNMMHQEDWVRFSKWLDTFKTETQWTFEGLMAEYEETNPPIRWWKHE